MQLSYETIRKIHRLERNSSTLIKISEGFFEGLEEYIEEEKAKIQNNDNIFDDSKFKILSNVKSMVEDILFLRQKKIINLAILTLKNNHEQDTKNLLQTEKRFLSKIVDSLKDYQTPILKTFEIKPKKKKKEKGVKLKIISQVPKFIGTDMKEYGPYKENEEIEIPKEIADLFVNKKIGEII